MSLRDGKFSRLYINLLNKTIDSGMYNKEYELQDYHFDNPGPAHHYDPGYDPPFQPQPHYQYQTPAHHNYYQPPQINQSLSPSSYNRGRSPSQARSRSPSQIRPSSPSITRPQLSPFLGKNTQAVIVPNELRECSDVVCGVAIYVLLGYFISVMIFGLVRGEASKVIDIHNSDEVRCSQVSEFPFGYLPDQASLSNAVCLKSCPSAANAVVSCLPDSNSCLSGSFTAPYASTVLDDYCLPASSNLEVLLNFNSFEQWAFDLREGWAVLVVSLFTAIFLSFMFLLLVRCCSLPLIWITILLLVGSLLTIGIFFILEARGVTVSDFISNNLSSLTFDALLTLGIYLIVSAFLLLLLAICLRSRIELGANAVKLGSLFIFQNCCVTMLPIFQAALVVLTLIALVAGGLSLYSWGHLSFPNNAAIPEVSLSPGQVAMMVFYIWAGIWLVFFFFGANTFMLSSSVCIWYFNNVSGSGGAPCCDSLWRLLRFHSGSVAFSSLLTGIFFVVKILANIFSFDSGDEDDGLVACCLKCLNFLFCIFKVFLRYLNDGAMVQMAINGQGYCASASKAFNLMVDHGSKVSVTEVISFLFSLLGVAGISVLISMCAYFGTLYLPYYQERIESPLIVCFVAGVIAFIISGIYLSMIDVTSTAVLQCFLLDQEMGRGGAEHANERVVQILLNQ